MKKMIAVFVMLSVSGVLVGCGGATQASSTPASGTNMTAGAWVITITNGGGGGTSNVVTTTVVGPNGTPADTEGGTISCSTASFQGPSDAETVVGPVCFIALGGGATGTLGNLSMTASGMTLGAMMMGVTANPAPNGSRFNFTFREGLTAASGEWQIDGTGTINNGTVSGTWSCDTSTPACSGISGTFTGTQQ